MRGRQLVSFRLPLTVRPFAELETAYDWLSGPDKGYGFASGGTRIGRWKEYWASIYVLLGMTDPNTGFIGDE